MTQLRVPVKGHRLRLRPIHRPCSWPLVTIGTDVFSFFFSLEVYVVYFEIYADVNGQWRWRLKAANHKNIANSGEGYYNKDNCLLAIGLVMDTDRDTQIYEV